MNIITSKFFGSGAATKRNMGYWCLALMKEVQKWCSDTLLSHRVDAVLQNERGIGAHKDFGPLLLLVLDNLRHLSSLTRVKNFMNKMCKA